MSPPCWENDRERGNCPSRGNMTVNDVSERGPLLTILGAPVHLRQEVQRKTAALSNPQL